jgi:DNA-binding beta-propeller fold protein YncE
MRCFIATALALLLPLTPTFARPAEPLLYVCVQDDAKIAVVDMETRELMRIIDLQALGFSATAKPHYVVVEPGGAHWYVSLIGEDRILKFNAANDVVGQFEMETPGMLALAPGSDILSASRSMSAVNPPKRVALVHTTTMEGEEIDVLFPRPHPMAIAGGYAYTGSLGVNQIASVELASGRPQVMSVAGPTHSLVQFSVSPDERTLVGTAEVSGQLLVFDLADPAKPALTKSIELGRMAFDPVFTPDGRAVWVPVKSTNEIVILDTTTWTETGRIRDESFKQPHQIVFSADGATAFVTNNNKMDHMADLAHAGHDMPGMAAGDGTAALSVIDVASRRVTKTLRLGKNLTGMGTRARR